METTWLSCQDAETILYSTIEIGGYHAAEKLGVPCFIATPLPGLAPTRTYPNPGGIFPELPLGGNYNQLTYFLNGQLLQAFTGQYINHWRREKPNCRQSHLAKILMANCTVSLFLSLAVTVPSLSPDLQIGASIFTSLATGLSIPKRTGSHLPDWLTF